MTILGSALIMFGVLCLAAGLTEKAEKKPNQLAVGQVWIYCDGFHHQQHEILALKDDYVRSRVTYFRPADETSERVQTERMFLTNSKMQKLAMIDPFAKEATNQPSTSK